MPHLEGPDIKSLKFLKYFINMQHVFVLTCGRSDNSGGEPIDGGAGGDGSSVEPCHGGDVGGRRGGGQLQGCLLTHEAGVQGGVRLKME